MGLFQKPNFRQVGRAFSKGLQDTGKFLQKSAGVANQVYNAAQQTGITDLIPGAGLIHAGINAVGTAGAIASTAGNALQNSQNAGDTAHAVFSGIQSGRALYNSLNPPST